MCGIEIIVICNKIKYIKLTFFLIGFNNNSVKYYMTQMLTCVSAIYSLDIFNIHKS